MIRDSRPPSEETRGLSETGDLNDSLLGLLREVLIDLGMHFVFVEGASSLFVVESSCFEDLWMKQLPKLAYSSTFT